jgi:serine phosphatase RsbU (regulator of sigma subunit)
VQATLIPAAATAGRVRAAAAFEPLLGIAGDTAAIDVAPDGSMRLSITDVTGHGIAASMVANRSDGVRRAVLAAAPAATPGEVLDALNRFLCTSLSNTGVFLSCFEARIDAASGTLSYAGAGHPPMLLLPARGEPRQLASRAPWLGIDESMVDAADTQSVPITSGDRVLLFTDGAMEAQSQSSSGRPIGLAGLLELARPAAADPEAWVARIARDIARVRRGGPEDDLLLVGAIVA